EELGSAEVRPRGFERGRGAALRGSSRGVRAPLGRGPPGGGEPGGLMRWESPWMLLALLLVPALVWFRRRGRSADPASVLWVRSGPLGARIAAAAVRSVDGLAWMALTLALLALAKPQQGVRLSETET